MSLTNWILLFENVIFVVSISLHKHTIIELSHYISANWSQLNPPAMCPITASIMKVDVS